nr:MAG TPA: chitin synthase regulator [Caudoviricetes sp.]
MRPLYQNKEVMDYTIIILFIIALLFGICWIARD